MAAQKKAQAIKPMLEDIIRVRLSDGTEIVGEFQIHSLADECVLNQHGFPISIANAEVLEIVEHGRFSRSL